MRLQVPFPVSDRVFKPKFGEVYKVGVPGEGGVEPNTYLLQDENGNEVVAVYVSEETIFDATPNDIREGKTAATGTGVTLGEKVIPSYHTSEGVAIVPVGGAFTIPLPILNKYDYTKLACQLCPYKGSSSESVATYRTVTNDFVYEVMSDTPISSVNKNDTDKTIELGITNNTDDMYVIRYFTYKDIA